MREMNMNCEGAESIVSTWQGGGAIERREFDALAAHIEECDECRGRYRMLVPFIARDLDVVAATAQAAPDEAFTRRVMGGIHGTTRSFPGRRTPPLLRRLVPAAAAAAVLLLALGLLIRGTAGGGSGEVTVHFVLDAPGAQAVSLVGSFNAWNPESLPLKRAPGTQQWKISVKLKRGETYLYNFVVNGKTWIPDPTTDLQVEDGFGGESSLMQL